ncbi:hypothetical protein A9Q98_13920 [Thalassotalea sp. 42_200_T64]|mgnify:CR=1 FL=1|nr:hypothetical protein A9Q98_13920 [Thalassotalea sp. 42_200_T64]
MWTTPSDLANYILAIQRARKGNTKGVLKPDIINQMLTVHHDSWGLGPELEQHDKGLVFAHGGKNAGFTNDFLAYADSAYGIVIMSNGDNAGPLIEELKIAISAHYGWDLAVPLLLKSAELAAKLRSSILATYSFDRDPEYTVSIAMNEGKIEVHDHGRDQKLQFIATGEDTITNLSSGSKVTFNTDSEGELVGLTWAGSYTFTKAED